MESQSNPLCVSFLVDSPEQTRIIQSYPKLYVGWCAHITANLFVPSHTWHFSGNKAKAENLHLVRKRRDLWWEAWVPGLLLVTGYTVLDLTCLGLSLHIYKGKMLSNMTSQISSVL